MDRSPAAGSAPRLVVRVRGSDRSLQPGPAYLLGRDQDCHIVVADNRVSRRHAEFRIEGTTWVLADRGSTNGIFAGGQRIGRLEITGDCVVRLGHPVHGLELSCALDIEPAQPAPSQDSPAIRLVAWPAPTAPPVPPVTAAAGPAGGGLREIPYALHRGWSAVGTARTMLAGPRPDLLAHRCAKPRLRGPGLAHHFRRPHRMDEQLAPAGVSTPRVRSANVARPCRSGCACAMA